MEIHGMIERLVARIEQEIPATGPFEYVYEYFENEDRWWRATNVCLFVVPLEKADGEVKRVLECRVYCLPIPYIASKVVASGTNEVLLEKLREADFPESSYHIFKELNNMFNEVDV